MSPSSESGTTAPSGSSAAGRGAPETVSLQAWTRQMDAYTGPDTLLDFNQVDNVCIDLTEANSSGQAQLMMGRPTRLSTIMREQAGLQRASRAARILRTKIHELSSQHGLDAAYLAAGTASWLQGPPRGRPGEEHGPSARGHAARADRQGAQRRCIAPVLLAPVTIRPRSDGDDFDLQIVGPAQLNPAMVRRLLADHGIDLSTGEIARLAYGTRRLDPAPVLESLRMAASDVPGMHVDHRLLISTFADLHDRPADEHVPVRTDVIRDLARLKSTAVGKIPQPRPLTNRCAPLDERDPASELLLLDADGSQQEVVDLAGQGESFVVTAAPGTGQIATAVNTVGALMAQGRSVLVLGERRAALSDFHRGFEMLGLSSSVLELGSHLTGEDVAAQLIESITRVERAREPELSGLHEQLRSVRDLLAGHIDALHRQRPRVEASAYQAMQALARLTARPDGPTTRVRFSRGVLDAAAHRTEITRQLERAAELGAFDAETLDGPWEGARLVNEEETRQARHLAQSLLLELSTLETGMRGVLSVSGLRPGSTVPEWGQQLRLLQEVESSLRSFTPDIFDRPVTDLIAATAGASWRRDHAIEMSGLQRSRLRKAAKEYIRPGVHLSDLHASLVKVQSERDRWRSWSATIEKPEVSDAVDDVAEMQQRFVEDLEGLMIALEGSRTGAGLMDLDAAQLRDVLTALIDDETSLETIPERTLLLEGLRDRGLGEFVDDLIDRRVPGRRVAEEFDLAWWQSSLEAMAADDGLLPMTEGSSLRRAEQEFRRADSAHISSGPARLSWAQAQRWRRLLQEQPEAAGELRAMLRQGSAPLPQLLRACGDLTRALAPVWTASPLVLSAALPDDVEIDAVVVLDGESTPLAAVLPAVTRAQQVIVLGDPALGRPQPFTVAPMTGPEPGPVAEVDSAFDALARVVDRRRLRVLYRDLDPELFEQLNQDFYEGSLTRLPSGAALTDGDSRLEVEYVADGYGELAAGHEGVQSPNVEVRRVVQLVIRHARLHPERSLAVVTPSSRHAARVAQGVSAVLGQRPELREFFRPGPESFRVVDLHRAVGLQRDTVIFSLGFGRTDHDRVLPYLGQLSDRDGRRGFVLGMTRSRQNTVVVSSIRPEDVEPSSLQNGARDLHRLLRRVEEAGNVRRDATDEPLLTGAAEQPDAAPGTSAGPDGDAEAAAGEVHDARETAAQPHGESAPGGSERGGPAPGGRPRLSLVSDPDARPQGSGGSSAGGGADGPADDGPGEEAEQEPAVLVHDPMELADAAVHEDALVQDLSRRLVQRGAAVRHHHEDVIDLVAWAETAESLSAGAVVAPRSDDRPVRIPVAVVSDGTDAVARMSVRERSRLRPQQLERSGWNHLTLWTIEVFTQPDAVADLIARYLGLSADRSQRSAGGSASGSRGR
ncbi:hypothetical protein [Kocuria palustris]|uniref:hypothetical protein n=1 Tax=Kocuria palustris TaxID=71999 RepID=UPI0011A4675D|nr:hypothetical protein [Kocuria palustris]